MELILLQNVRNLGELGDQVRVKSGYGRNFLLPRGIALPASSENKAYFESRKSELVAAAGERQQIAESRAEALQGCSVTVPMRASDEGKLYGSVGPHEIVNAASEDGFEVDAKEVTLTEGAIHQIGRYTVLLQLHPEVEVEMGVIVAQLTDAGVIMPPEEKVATEPEEAPAAEPAEAASQAELEEAEFAESQQAAEGEDSA